MTAVDEFLGTVAAQATRRVLSAGALGVRLQEVTTFDVSAFLTALVSDEPIPWVAIAGVSDAQLRKHSKAAGAAAGTVTNSLVTATDWRNDPKVVAPIVVVAFGEEERLGSFHRFKQVRDRDLYGEICQLALEGLCPNEVLKQWWGVLGRKAVRAQISVQRLANYYSYLQERAEELPSASREGLFFLGLLPSREFFDGASPSRLFRKYLTNRQLIERVEILTKPDRERLMRVAARSKANSQTSKTLGDVLQYARRADDDNREALWAEDVQGLFESARTTSKSKGGGGGSVKSEQVAADGILRGDDSALQELVGQLEDELEQACDDRSQRLTLPGQNGGEQVVVNLPSNVLTLVGRTVTRECFGGMLEAPQASNLNAALSSLDESQFTPYEITDPNWFAAKLSRVVAHGGVEQEVLEHWKDLTKAREKLVAKAATIAVSPLLCFAGERRLLEAGEEYLAAYESLLAALRDRYEVLSQYSPAGTRALCTQLMLADTLLVKAESGVYAMLLPLHPLHLWKYVRLARQMREQRDSLSDEYKDLLSSQVENLPDFLTAFFVPEKIVADQAMVLPQAGHVGTLPYYQQEDPRFTGKDGQDRVVRTVHKFLGVYPHARHNLRICLVDPPYLAGILEEIAGQVLSGQLPLEGVHILVKQTQQRDVNLGDDDEQIETIAEVFAEHDSGQFVVELSPEKTAYADVINELADRPVHLLAVFDPSKTHVGQYAGRDTGTVHPLVLPKEFRYDPMEDKLEIMPAATGDIFDLYHSIQSRVNNALSKSHFAVGTSLAEDFPDSQQVLQGCTWLVVLDRLLDAQPLRGGHLISLEQRQHRDVAVLTANLTKFEREFGYRLRQVNLDPSEESIRELIASSADLVGEGLLGLIRLDGN